MGSPDFSLPSLRALADAHEVVGVVTQPDRASGRGRELKPPPIKLLAQELGIPVIQPEKLRQPEAMEQLRLWNPDLIVVAAFGQILRRNCGSLRTPRTGCAWPRGRDTPCQRATSSASTSVRPIRRSPLSIPAPRIRASACSRCRNWSRQVR